MALLTRKSSEITPSPVHSLHEAVDEMFENLTQQMGMSPWSRLNLLPWREVAESGTIRPAMNLVENDKNFVLTVDLPGVDPANIDIDCSGNTLQIRGERKEEKKEEKDNYFLYERSYGNFARTMTLPAEVVTDKIKASYKNGVLSVTLPKTVEARGQHKKIAVKAE